MIISYCVASHHMSRVEHGVTSQETPRFSQISHVALHPQNSYGRSLNEY